MTERQFQTALQDGAAARGWHPTPIPDSGGGARFSAPRIYDLVLSKAGISHHIELKKVHGKKFSWPIKDLKPHQVEGLLGAADAGLPAWVIVLWQVILGPTARKSARWRDHEKHEGAYAVRVHQILEARDLDFKSSLTLDWFFEKGLFLPRLDGVTTPEGNPKDAWDPTPLEDAA